MRKILLTFFVLLGVSCALWAQTHPSGSSPKPGGTYYLWNEGQQSYLSARDGQLTLGSAPLSVTVTSRPDSTGRSFGTANDHYVELTVGGGRLSASPYQSPRSDGEGQGTEWTLQPVGDGGSYALACRLHDANGAEYLYYSELAEAADLSLVQPDSTFLNGMWQLVSADDVQLVMLDEDDSTYTQPTLTAPEATVLLKRTLNLNTWNTFSVPFAIGADALKAQLGDDVQVARFTGIDGSTLLFTLTDGVEAGVPCLIKPTKGFAEGQTYYTFDGVTAFADAPSVTQVVDTAAGGATISYLSTYHLATIPAGAYVVDGMAVSHVAGEEPVKGFRGYLVQAGGTSPSTITEWRLVDPSTGISGITTGKTDNKVFNIQGQRLPDSPSLPHGVYIINGKKVIQ